MAINYNISRQTLECRVEEKRKLNNMDQLEGLRVFMAIINNRDSQRQKKEKNTFNLEKTMPCPTTDIYDIYSELASLHSKPQPQASLGLGHVLIPFQTALEAMKFR